MSELHECAAGQAPAAADEQGGTIPGPLHVDLDHDTEWNFATKEPQGFVGDHAALRARLDYTYHWYYSPARQAVQDDIMHRFERTIVVDKAHHIVCARPTRPWIVFTAGAMGAGKSRAMQWLHSRNYFPLQSFVAVDPDRIRYSLPEWKAYLARDQSTAGTLTHKEAGYIAELLTLEGLKDGKNILVDGSLRDADWHAEHFDRIRQEYPRIRIAIIHCDANPENIVARAQRRAEQTGRSIPEHTLFETITQVPHSVEKLRPLVDQYVKLNTDGESPTLVQGAASFEELKEIWAQECFEEEALGNPVWGVIGFD